MNMKKTPRPAGLKPGQARQHSGGQADTGGSATAEPSPVTNPRGRCEYVSADGRRCRALRSRGHASLCPAHQRHRQELIESEAVAAELLGAFQEFKTGTALNHALTRLFALLARNRIPVRNAAVLACIAQLIMNTLPTVRKEASLGRARSGWEAMVRRALRAAAGKTAPLAPKPGFPREVVIVHRPPASTPADPEREA